MSEKLKESIEFIGILVAAWIIIPAMLGLFWWLVESFIQAISK